MKALSYAFSRIGACIRSGGRRMDRLAALQRAKFTPPEVEGRFTKKGSFKEIIKGLRQLGTPNAEGNYETDRPIRTGRVFYPHTKSTRRERRAAAKSARKAAKAATVHAANQSPEHLLGVASDRD